MAYIFDISAEYSLQPLQTYMYTQACTLVAKHQLNQERLEMQSEKHKAKFLELWKERAAMKKHPVEFPIGMQARLLAENEREC